MSNGTLPLSQEQIEAIISAVNLVLKKALFLFTDHPPWKGRTGGYFCLADADTGLLLFGPTRIGEVPHEKAEKYLTLCHEKAKRLAEHPEHLSSWESRNPDANQWGGAVRVGNDLIFSISGLPEMGDEAVMLATAGIHYHGTSKVLPSLNVIAERSRNEYSQPLLKSLGREI